MSRAVTETRILVLNYNGRALMAECLPSIVEAAAASRRKVTVTVIDNRSADDSVAFLRREFPSVHVHEAPENRILCSYNDALRLFTEPVVILLNNDIKVDRAFIDPLIDLFEKDDELFAAGSKCLDFNGLGFQGEKSIGGLRWGMFWTNSRYPGYRQDIDKRSWTVQVALGAFDREKFVELGGYDDLFLPGTWEDTDLCLRAYRRGWHCVYEPTSVIYHKGQVTFHREFGKKGSAELSDRNSFLFLWKNFAGTPAMAQHWFFLPARLVACLLLGRTEFVTGFIKALKMRPLAVSRIPTAAVRARSDREVLSIFASRERTE